MSNPVPRTALVRLAAAICALAALSLAAAAVAAGEDPLADVKAAVRARFADVPQTDTTTLHDGLADPSKRPPLLLDARARVEYAVSHISGARLADSTAAALRALDGLPLDTPIVAYCSIGYRSSALVRELRRAGYGNASNLEGSLFEWANRGYPVERAGRATHEVHPYGWPWSRYLDPQRRASPPWP